jgi:putative hydrolases of HD superfamily
MELSKVMRMDLIYAFFDAANMHRWNDRIRPIDLTELDKQAHKMAIAWVIGKYEEDAGMAVRWRSVIENVLFSFMQRMALTDLKPELFHRMRADKKEEMNSFVLSEMESRVPCLDRGLHSRFEAYLDSDGGSEEEKIVDAAHYLASRWEFNLIKDSNRSMHGMGEIAAALDEELESRRCMVGVERIMSESTFGFVDLIGQLRFQQRWARTPRVPQTTVLGHSLLVAVMTYLHDLDEGAGDRQVYNDFFTALFHDLPEVLTKDVITPVKTSIDGLVELLDDYERELVESKIVPLIPEGWRGEFRFMVYDPFTDKNDPEYGIRHGRDIKSCDTMGAYIEAHVSGCYGITSRTLTEGEANLRIKLMGSGEGIDAKGLIEQLDRMRI